jgi:hypothetical protein
MFHWNERFDSVFGVDYLDRDDYKLLPVIGFSWHNPDRPEWRLDMIYPRPRVYRTFSTRERVYLGGLLGGDTWDIEMPGDVNDVMTYRDLRLLFGYEWRDNDKKISGVELGYVFDRSLQFRTSTNTSEFDDAFVIRFITTR